ncbi:hypothetical protein VTJ04DRAFT_10525 [Mycothermus thermophilus]|uniref:uncharacterized protein n=1 Tax=Humicola insolens TaxID=85995 RepID=UPI003742F626
MSTTSLPPSTSIPVASLGAKAEVASAIRKLLEPEYDLVHMCLSPAAASAELPAVCAGDLSVPDSTGIGSNASRPESERRVPRAIIFGGAVDDATLESIMSAVREAVAAKGGKEIGVVRVLREDVKAEGVDFPNAEILTKIIRRKLGVLEGEGKL